MKAPTKRLGTAVLLMSVLLFPSMALAQRASPGQAYVFGAVGDWTDAPEFLTGVGIGYERMFFRGLGVGAEIQGFAVSGEYAGVTVSFNGSYHFKSRTDSRKLVPFATAGYTGMAVGNGGYEGINLGGGATYWLTPGKGIRVEFRDHVFTDSTTTWQKREMRIGFSF